MQVNGEIQGVVAQKRCILIFPEFNNMHIIDRIREEYDPLAQHVRPHITLVFPFYSRLETAELEAHLRDKLSKVRPFALSLRGITPAFGHGNYLFLNVEQGMDELVAISEDEAGSVVYYVSRRCG